MKLLVRRIAVGVAIISFLIPWFNVFFTEITGLSLMVNSLGIGTDFNVPELITVGVTILVILVLAIWTLIQPKILPTILFLIPSTIVLLIVFNDEYLSLLRLHGMTIFSLGVIGVYVSLFLKVDGSKKMINHVNQPVNEIAVTVDKPVVAMGGVNPRVHKFCSNCGNELNTGNKFCKNCGTKTTLK